MLLILVGTRNDFVVDLTFLDYTSKSVNAQFQL